MNKILKGLFLVILINLLFITTALASINQFGKSGHLPVTLTGNSQGQEVSTHDHNDFGSESIYTNTRSNTGLCLSAKTPKFYKHSQKNASLQISAITLKNTQTDPTRLSWSYSALNSSNSIKLTDYNTSWQTNIFEIDSQDVYGLQTPAVNGLSLFSPDNKTDTVYLIYDGSQSIDVNVYTLKAGDRNTKESDTIDFIIEESPIDTVKIAGVDGKTAGSPVVVDLTKNQNYQLISDAPQEADGGNTFYSLSPRTANNKPTSDYAEIDSATGLVTFNKPLEEGDSIAAELEVDGIKSQEPVIIETQGNVDTPGITGIKPAIPTIFVNSTKTYKPINNLITDPFEKPVEGTVSFSSSSFQITSSGSGANYELKAPSSSYTGNTIVTATYKTGGGNEYTTNFSVEFIGNKNIDVSALSVIEELSFTLRNTSTQNIGASLLPEDVTEYDQNINYLELFDYSTSDQKVAYVDSYGNVTPVGVGTCTITTTYSSGSTSLTKETKITVVDENVGSITLNPLLLNLNLTNKKTGTITATVYPEDLDLTPTWSVSNELVAEIDPDGLNVHITAKSVGTVTITASCLGQKVTATVQVTQNEIYPESLSLYPNAVYLATQGTLDATVFSVVTANVFPGNATSEITWTSDTDIFSFTPAANGQTVSIVPKDKTGIGFLTATAKGKNGENITATLPVTISNKPVVIDTYRTYIQGNIITADSPDSFKVNVYAMANPAFKVFEGNNVRRVTMFAWSNLGQTDIDCKVANFEGNGLFSYTFPVNMNEEHNFFERACNIRIGIYGSFEEQNGNLMTSVNYNYTNPNDWQTNVAVTPYCQNLGFITPTVGENSVAGTEGRNLALEGIRIASPIDGLGLIYAAHVEDFGWIEEVSSGTYCGTMHLNKQLEAVRIELTGPQANNYSVRYQVHAETLGWMDWVSDGEMAGTIGENRQLEAIRIMIVPRS